jgi:ADP-ribosyl-[dinitrogen reductase] hydrolase
LEKYVVFMTTPGTHNGTCASAAHRVFFENYAYDKQTAHCAESDCQNTDTMDLLILVAPVTVMFAQAPVSVRHELVQTVLHALRRTSSETDRIALIYSDLLCNVLKGATLERELQYAGHMLCGQSYSVREQVAAALAANRPDPLVSGQLNVAFAAMLFFAMKYGTNAHEDPVESALLASANAGGENMARGAALGALLGAAYGLEAGVPHWMKIGLVHGGEIWNEAQSALTACDAVVAEHAQHYTVPA